MISVKWKEADLIIKYEVCNKSKKKIKIKNY